jgi:signal transduction histidine kinase
MHANGIIIIHGVSGLKSVEVRITDSGPGIPPDLHDRIFELNFSGRPGVHPGKLGFGLWWVKNLMTRLGGSVTVESDGQHGTTFVLRLPCAELEGKHNVAGS